MKKVILAAVIAASFATTAQANNSNSGLKLGWCNTTIPFPGMGWLGYVLYRPCVGAN